MMGYNFVLGDVLAMGSAPPETIKLKSIFDVVVLCAEEYQPAAHAFPDVRLMRVSLDDSGPPPTPTEVLAAVAMGKQVASLLRRNKRVLVTCYMGRNRSGIVTAIALMELGLSARAAIHSIRAARGPKALSNTYFNQIIKRYRPSFAAASAQLSR